MTGPEISACVVAGVSLAGALGAYLRVLAAEKRIREHVAKRHGGGSSTERI
jgi:hypothetical protein